MFFSLFKKNSGCIEKEMENLLEKEDKIVEDNKNIKYIK
jgi:hypothetical protein